MRNIISILIIVLATVVAAVLLWPRKPDVPAGGHAPAGGEAPAGPTTQSPPPDLPRVFALRNRGNAHLEDGEYTEAAAAYDELGRLLPDEPLGFRNQTIGALLKLQGVNRTSDPDAFAAALAAARRPLAESKRLEPNSIPVLRLSSRIAAAAGELDQSAADLRAAIALAPQDASLWYELAERMRIETAPERQATFREALAQAHEYAPGNLFVLQDALLASARGEDPQFGELLTEARPVIAAVAESVQQRTRFNPLQLLDRAEAAWKEQNWKGVASAVMPLGNLLKGDDAARSDLARIDVHPLEFMVFHFATLGEDAAESAANSEAPEPEVAFSAGAAVNLDGDAPVLDATFGDLGLDGRDELWVLREGRLDVLASSDGGQTWSLATTVETPAGYQRIILADLDQDVVETSAPADAPAGQLPDVCHLADLDAVLCGEAGVLLLRNDDEGGTRRLTPASLPEQPAAAMVSAIVVGDLNSDGDLDLALITPEGLQCWSNRGEFQFVALPVPEAPAAITAVTLVDLDRDIDLDVAAGLANGAVGYLENLRYGTFRWREISGPPAEGGPVAALDVVDSDGNGSWDVVAATATAVTRIPSRWIQPGEVQFGDAEPVTGLQGPELLCGDFNNSGRIDLLARSEAGLELALGANGGSWRAPVNLTAGAGSPLRRCCSSSDFDADGDLDLLTVREAGVTILPNETAAAGAWLEIGLQAQQVKEARSAASGRVNHYGVGSLMEVRSGAQYQARVVRGAKTHFGLGPVTSPDALRIVWTNGIPENLVTPPARQYICERQTLKGSCPYLYTWNGREFEFVTDLLWAAPIGLVSPSGELVPSREWEYLLVPGASLQPAEGEYRLAITEELWEAAYFDHVELIAVDHPQDVAVFTNEKVGPPALAEPRIHTVTNRRHPVAVRDQQGRDLLPLVLKSDERYAVPFEHKLRQGYTEETALDIDLGLSQRPERVTLFLTGWVYPTDTSINIGLAEDEHLPGPRPPSIAVPDAQGEWREVIPYCGFPGGKTKTIAIELPGDLFTAPDYRLRLRTSMELAWDEIFFTVDEPAIEVREQPLTLLSAELRPRGFSAAIPHPDFGPERYDYKQVSTAAHWPAMGGRFTRYGDVTALIAAADDRQAVFGSGDEMLVRFAAPPEPPPPGWSRDFVLHNVGWDKDADLHTVYGQTVEPLPLRGMTRYPDATAEETWSRPEMAAYLRDYQTREFDPRTFGRRISASSGPDRAAGGSE